MQPWVDRHPLAFVLAVFLPIFLSVPFVVSCTGGWSLLARTCRYRGTFNGPKWRGESGRMHGIAHYRNCLVIGASPEGLYVSVFSRFVLPIRRYSFLGVK
jgi:hypothetical protein